MQDFLADTHLHLYPCFDLDRAFSQLLDRFQEMSETITMSQTYAACLAERYDCKYFSRLLSGEDLLADFTVEDACNHSLVLRRHSDNGQLTLLPGRQVIARERIEVLALCCPGCSGSTGSSFPSDMAAADLIRAVAEQDGVAVLPWSPGKWFGKRGKVINGLLAEFTPRDFLLGDVSLRPVGWPTPLLMRKAQRAGYKIIHGSDPLPFSGEEQCFGMYGSRIRSDGPKRSPGELLRSLLQGEAAELTCWGRRSGPVALLQRLRKNAGAD